MRETRVFLHGDIDLAAAPEVRTHLFEAVESTNHDLAVDCCGVTFMDSTGVALIMATQARLRERGRLLRIVNADATTERVLAVLGLSETLRVNRSAAGDPTTS
jgi:anti-anti-sigma factor